jgi:hypothetical protein
VNTSNKHEIDYIHTVILYESKSGKIVHTHQEVFFKGTDRLEVNEIESKALKLAKNNKELNTMGIHVLHLAGEDIDDTSSYEVDIQNKRLVKKKPS